ncbi:flagellar filament capping protein FliD [Aestuariirhabdus sp. Z084]|uniref:flagellar filament capping protein FliD n=1 Tax=Aestuariirhabdus haliotis TaxID=2918751 RepID=UPI00201B3BEC|nr:flagellar filament capping protein FliD [Aestuariirhabdus haliotis]MCL6414453.1 flagellar filament capping protein FliD [Aestuariirhabdus haliotis]MCL6418565.1 flagellar filament capping protein FliD [Aestuariirhabdus haliotis]
MSIGGVNSGLDIPTIVKALVDAEKAPKTAQLNRIERDTTEQITGLGQLMGAVSAFKTAVDGLDDLSSFNQRTPASSDTDILTLTATEEATAGNYNISVESLAQAQKIATGPFADAEAAIGTGTITIGQGADSFDIVVGADNNTLSGIKDAINEASDNTGVTATIVTDDSGARLVLSSDKQGLSNQLSLTVNDDDGNSAAGDAGGGLSDLVYDPLSGNGSLELTAATDAVIKIDGLTVTRSSNTISDAIEGVTLNLKAAQSADDIAAGKTVSAKIALDKAGPQGRINEFVEAYNALIDVTKELTAVVAVGGDETAPVTGALLGDASVRQLVSQIRSELIDPTGDSAIGALSQLGVTSTKEGRLEVDSSVLTDQLDNNYSAVGEFLAGENGLMGRLSETVASYEGSGGVLSKRVDSLQNRIESIDDDRLSLNLRVAKMEERLNSQFYAMDQLVGQYNNTLEYITGALKNLPGVVKQSSD